MQLNGRICDGFWWCSSGCAPCAVQTRAREMPLSKFVLVVEWILISNSILTVRTIRKIDEMPSFLVTVIFTKISPLQAGFLSRFF